MTYESMIKNIDDMPPLSDIARVMQSLYASGVENVDVKKLTRMIESDVMLTANVLKMINSPYYGFKNKISSVSQAISLFGIQKIYALVINFAMSKQLKANTAIYGFNNAQFNEMCILQSSLMMQWYATVDIRSTHILAAIALIMESGKIIVSKELHASDYLEEYRKGFLACTNIQEFEKEFLDTTSYYLSSILFEHWNLEPIYVRVLKALDSLEECDAVTRKYANAIDVVRTAINLKEVLTDQSIEKASKKVKEMGLDSEGFEVVAYKVKKKYEEF